MLEMELLHSASSDLLHPIGGRDLLTAIGHLYKSLDLVGGARNRVSDGVFDGVFTSSDLAEGWFEVNSCRVYTETSTIIDEYLLPAMGLINDAKSMIDSLMAWGLGMTANAKIHIINCLKEAESVIHAVVEELESWVGMAPSDAVCPGCGKKYVYGDNFCSGCGHRLADSGGHSLSGNVLPALAY